MQYWPVIGYDLVVHAAAHVGGRSDIDNRAAYLGAYNAQLDGAFFEWVLRTKPRHVVYLSSSAVYPVTLQGEDGVPLVETMADPMDPRLPDQTYGWTKLVGERWAAEVNALGSTRVHIVRPFSGYGCGQSVDYPFIAFAERARSREDPFKVWGSGLQVRDWIHIDDVVAGIMAVVEADVIEPVNLGTGRGLTMIEVAELVTEAAGYDPDLAFDPDMHPGVLHRVADTTRMRAYYTPTIDVESGILRVLAGR
jgi:nucleoside-diphosphate-sugar epimerase